MAECITKLLPRAAPEPVKQQAEQADLWMSKAEGGKCLEHVSDFFSKYKGKCFTLKEPAGTKLRIADVGDTIYRAKKEVVNGWGKFYLPDIVTMQVVGVVEGTSCPCDELVLMTCEDKHVYAYDGDRLHLVASDLVQVIEGIEYPASTTYYRGEVFIKMTKKGKEGKRAAPGLDTPDKQHGSKAKGGKCLEHVSDFFSKYKDEHFTLKEPAGTKLRIVDVEDTIYRDKKEVVNGWGKFYLPDIVNMQVVGVVEGTSCPCDELVLMTCEDRHVYAYDGEELHLVALVLFQIIEAIEYPASTTYYRGEAFKDMTKKGKEGKRAAPGLDTPDKQHGSKAKGGKCLELVSDFFSKYKGKCFTLKEPAGTKLRIVDVEDTIYRDKKEVVNGWGKFYLPDIVTMQVVGVVEGTSCPCNELVLMTCEDRHVYAYDGDELHLVALVLFQIIEAIEYPASTTYYRGEAFKDMTKEDWEEVRKSEEGKKLDEEHLKLVTATKAKFLENLRKTKKKI